MTWQKLFEQEQSKDYFKSLQAFINAEYSQHKIFPPKDEIYKAFELTPFERVKVVILGQDPYPTAGQAHGLSFSVKRGSAIPASLKNIFKELGLRPPFYGDLTDWATQGVLLLNCVLTVREGERNSHKGMGFEVLTNAVIAALNLSNNPIVFMLWGNDAQKKAELITNPAHLVLKAAHPSPLSAGRGFFGCNHFSKANEFLAANGIQCIDWVNSRNPQ